MEHNFEACRLTLLGLGLGVFASTVSAQVFTVANNDLILGFRKNAPYTENYEVLVSIGQASNYIHQAVGTTVTVPGYSAAQLVPGSFSSVNDLSWSVFGAYSGTAYAGYVTYTLWLTVPRPSNAVQSSPPTRLSYTLQGGVRGKMASIWGSGGAGYISLNIGSSNQFNTPTLVRESLATYPSHILSVWMKSLVDPNSGTFNDAWPPSEPNAGNVENTTSDTFSGTVRSDLYEVRPLTTAAGVAVVDPHTGLASGPAWYIGYFELKSDGTMTFTREQSSSPPPPPPPPQINIARIGNVSTISFVTSNTATYTLFFTNSSGLTAPVTTWPSLPGNITGNGSTQLFQDTTTDPIRFYRVEGR